MAGGILNGTVKSFVREDNGSEIWVQQDMDMGFLGNKRSKSFSTKRRAK
jgi:hypothetical protein